LSELPEASHGSTRVGNYPQKDAARQNRKQEILNFELLKSEYFKMA
jgi:hypothetical protein